MTARPDLPAAAPPARTLGAWNAYVEQGRSLQDRRARLAEVPEHLRESVQCHLATVWALKDAARLQPKTRRRAP